MYLMCMVRHIGHVWQDIWAKHGTMYGVGIGHVWQNVLGIFGGTYEARMVARKWMYDICMAKECMGIYA